MNFAQKGSRATSKRPVLRRDAFPSDAGMLRVRSPLFLCVPVLFRYFSVLSLQTTHPSLWADIFKNTYAGGKNGHTSYTEKIGGLSSEVPILPFLPMRHSCNALRYCGGLTTRIYVHSDHLSHPGFLLWQNAGSHLFLWRGSHHSTSKLSPPLPP